MAKYNQDPTENKEILKRFLKQKRAYAQFQRSIHKAWNGISFDEFIRLGEVESNIYLAISVIALHAVTETERKFWQHLEQQWTDYLRTATEGINIK